MSQNHVELILARKLAEGLVVPALLVDGRGDTLYFNEPAEFVFGRSFDDIDSLPFEERTQTLAPLTADGAPIPPESLPGMQAMLTHKPVYAAFYIHGLDGVLRPIEATAIPLESAGGDLVGALVFLWPDAASYKRGDGSEA